MSIPQGDTAPEILVLLSGGADSAACLHFYRELGRPTSCLFIDYQQSALKEEADAAREIAGYYDVQLSVARFVGEKGKGAGWVGGRNAFLLCAALMELRPTISAVGMGIHSGTSYSDCTPKFLERMQDVYDIYSTTERVKVVAPFIEWTKAEVWKYARSAGVPRDLQRPAPVNAT